ncbi:pectinesterase family protein [Loktanella sp. TSTF-M6]|uniref:Pectinesterase n=1 Tax=Loktanella gaetbuli TaxID=2881335 RepID=A0ABS8BXL7_9RHOB|nr:pectinesterase family protein [Loktanella gaetbuli]MCB5200439.1 pectinesterase family protein [Loktanella gaetbuli]
MRPQLTPAQAAGYTRSQVLRYVGSAGAERDDPWTPEPLDPARLVPDYVVGSGCDADGVQTAVNLAIAEGRTGRVVIGIAAGTHAGLVYLPRGAARFTLVGLGDHPADVVLSENIDAEMSGTEYSAKFGQSFAQAHASVRSIHDRIAALDTITTANASVIRVEADGTQLVNLTVRNTYNCDRAQGGSDDRNAAGQFTTGQHQAVALLVAGADRVQVQNVALKSFQDTLYLQSPTRGETVRSCFTDCDIEGDVDFIFGQSTAWFARCTIRTLTSRAAKSWATAPSTDIRTRFGFVFHDCHFTHDGHARPGQFHLGRQWFEGVRATPFGLPDISGYRVTIGPTSAYHAPVGTISLATLNAVGKCVILHSRIAGHIDAASPWDAWSGNTWNPRHRPVLYRAADMLSPLADWLRQQGQSYDDICPDTIFLGEYGNSTA